MVNFAIPDKCFYPKRWAFLDLMHMEVVTVIKFLSCILIFRVQKELS